MKLYSYWRSTTSYRVRIALNMKGLSYETIPVDLVAGAQKQSAFAAINPGMGVPALVLDDGTVMTQSMAILEWLEESHPQPGLLPADATNRAHVRAAALTIATDIHPINNLRVLGQLKALGHSQEECVEWMNHWMMKGFEAFEKLIDPDAEYCFGDAPSLADICLIPQLYNAHRWGCDMSKYSRLTQIEQRCLILPAFEQARPENQPDAV